VLVDSRGERLSVLFELRSVPESATPQKVREAREARFRDANLQQFSAGTDEFLRKLARPFLWTKHARVPAVTGGVGTAVSSGGFKCVQQQSKALEWVCHVIWQGQFQSLWRLQAVDAGSAVNSEDVSEYLEEI
jgi:hypothetical protein